VRARHGSAGTTGATVSELAAEETTASNGTERELGVTHRISAETRRDAVAWDVDHG
jgi:hypothetical protein